MAEQPKGGAHALLVTYFGLAVTIGGWVYTAGGVGQRVDNNSARIAALEQERSPNSAAMMDIRERLARIEAILTERTSK